MTMHLDPSNNSGMIATSLHIRIFQAVELQGLFKSQWLLIDHIMRNNGIHDMKSGTRCLGTILSTEYTASAPFCRKESVRVSKRVSLAHLCDTTKNGPAAHRCRTLVACSRRVACPVRLRRRQLKGDTKTRHDTPRDQIRITTSYFHSRRRVATSNLEPT